MPESISVQILTQTSNNIQKLFELTTRIDERVKSIQEKQAALEDCIEGVVVRQTQLMERVVVVETNDVVDIEDKLNVIDKRLTKLESDAGRSSDTWKGVLSFVVQLIWVIVAAFVLVKLNLQAPNVP